MRNYQILLAIVTIVVLCALDGHMAGTPMYGWAFRSLVGLVLVGQVAMLCTGVRARVDQEDLP